MPLYFRRRLSVGPRPAAGASTQQRENWSGGPPMPLRKATWIVLSFLATVGFPLAAIADGQPELWQMGLQKPETPIMDQIVAFHTGLLWLISGIAGFVLVLMIIVIVRFNAKANPTPSKTTHNTLIEVAWTGIPVVILVLMAIPSFKLLYAEDVVPKADLTFKATGHQWYWSYQYPDQGNFGFDAVLVEDKDLKPGQPRLLTPDNSVVVPVNKVVKVIVTADDVIHSWAVPSFGVKIDAVPGRLNQTWFKAERTGTFYGQCSELCGDRHGFMPIKVEVVSQQDFDAWVAKQRKAAGLDKPREHQVAQNNAAQ